MSRIHQPVIITCYCTASAEKKRASQAVRQEKGNLLGGKREGDWPLKRTSILPFWRQPSYTPPMKNSLKGWSHSQRSGIWWSRSFKKISASEITGCHLGNLVNLKDHCELFFVCKIDIMNHLISETPCGPYQLLLPKFKNYKLLPTGLQKFSHVCHGVPSHFWDFHWGYLRWTQMGSCSFVLDLLQAAVPLPLSSPGSR